MVLLGLVWFVLLGYDGRYDDLSFPGHASVTARCQWQSRYALPSTEAGVGSIEYNLWVEATPSPYMFQDYRISQHTPRQIRKTASSFLELSSSECFTVHCLNNMEMRLVPWWMENITQWFSLFKNSLPNWSSTGLILDSYYCFNAVCYITNFQQSCSLQGILRGLGLEWNEFDSLHWEKTSLPELDFSTLSSSFHPAPCGNCY